MDRLKTQNRSWSDFKSTITDNRDVRLAVAGITMALSAYEVGRYLLQVNVRFAFSQGLGYAPSSDAYQGVVNFVLKNVYTSLTEFLAILAVIPIIDAYSRRRMQAVGFAVMVLLCVVFGSAYMHLTAAWQVAVFVLTALTAAVPAVTTFLVPTEFFPTRYRATMVGMVYGMAKLCGLLVVQLAAIDYGTLMDQATVQLYVVIAAVLFAAGGVMTPLIPETRGKRLEELSLEIQVDFVKA